jgi:predicted negative regulator of RcsB-dependent stress response
MKNFIEIGRTEDEQEQQVKNWLKENIPQIVAGIVLGLGGIWGIDYYKSYQTQQSVEARLLYLNANPNAFEKLNTDYKDSGYSQQAILMQAKTATEDKNYSLALQKLATLIDNENTLIANIANMRMASVQLEMGDYEKAIATLDSKTSGEFNGLYNQLKGDIYVASEQIEKAREHYKIALEQISADSKIHSLINIKLSDLN